MTSNKKQNPLKIQLALASSLFFAPFVQHLIKKDQITVEAEDKKFVEGYVRMGMINIGLLLLTLATALSMYFFTTATFSLAYKISSTLLIVSVVSSIVLAIANVKILQENQKLLHFQKIENERSDIFLSFLPIYNIFLWYKVHDFEHPYRRAKESILWWTLFILVSVISQSPAIASLILMMIIVRVASLMAGIDILDEHVKKHINTLFLKNPEEIRGNIRATILFWGHKLSGHTAKPFKELLDQQKSLMGHLHKLENQRVVAQYTLAMILLGLRGWIGYSSEHTWLIISTLILVVARYGLMIIKWQHLPPLPLCKELVDLSISLYQKLFKKNTTPDNKKI